MNLSRRTLLCATAATLGAAAVPSVMSRARAQSGVVKRHLITVLAYGGWDTTYALDPKPGLASIDAPPGDIVSYGDIAVLTHADRPSVAGFFQRWADQCAVINGIQMQSIVHTDCTKRLLTGTASDANPDMGSISAFELARDLPAPYLVLGPTAYTGPLASISARAGTVNQIRTLLDPAAAFPAADPTMAPRFAPDLVEGDLIRQYTLARAEREAALRGQHGDNQRRFADFLSSLDRSDVLRDFSDGFGTEFAFTLDIREQVKLGLEAIERGVCHSLHLEQSFAQWDTHTGNQAQNGMHEDLYSALDLLADELSTRPGQATGHSMLDETVVAVLSEMGRTPKLNEQQGKDHWPVTSAMILGSGVRHGRYGQSSAELTADNVDYLTGAYDAAGRQLQYGNLAAGILQLVGVDPEPYLPGREPFAAFIA